jgi:hypothetical protein
MMNRFEDSLLAFNKYNHNIDSIDEFGALVMDIRDLYNVTYYLESINNNFKLKNISADDFGYIVTSLNEWIVNYLDIHKKLYKEDRSLAETYYESYNEMASLLYQLSRHLVIMSSSYHDNFRVLTYELKFDKNSYDELSNIIQELNEVLDTFDSNQIVVQIEMPTVESTSPSTEPDKAPLDKPTIPQNVHEDLHYLWDFTFSGRYDARMTDDFSLTLSDKSGQVQGTYTLFDHFNVEEETINVLRHESDDLAPPSQHNLYWFASQNGGLFVDTDYYALDNQEFISYLWTNSEGMHTNKGVAVGGTESNLLRIYEDD